MNERIQELLDQVGGYGTKALMHPDDIQKFSELLIRDCLDVIANQTTLDTNEYFREGFSHGRKLAWQEIRRKFELQGE